MPRTLQTVGVNCSSRIFSYAHGLLQLSVAANAVMCVPIHDDDDDVRFDDAVTRSRN